MISIIHITWWCSPWSNVEVICVKASLFNRATFSGYTSNMCETSAKYWKKVSSEKLKTQHDSIFLKYYQTCPQTSTTIAQYISAKK